MLGCLVHIDRGVGFVLSVSLALLDLTRTTGSDEMDAGKLAVGVGLLQFLLHRVGQVLDAELERGLPCGHLILAAESIDISLVILGDRERSEIELREIEGIVLPGFHKNRRRAERAPVEIEFVNLGVEITARKFGLHDLGATLEPLLDLVLALHRLRRFQAEPPAFERRHPTELAIGQNHVCPDGGGVEKLRLVFGGGRGRLCEHRRLARHHILRDVLPERFPCRPLMH